MPGIYLDHAATTPVRPEVREAMLPYLKEQYGNPSGLYQLAVEAEEAMEAARKTIAATLGCETEEIYFTSGGTESDNWAIKSAVEAAKKRKDFGTGGRRCCHIITTQIEHHAVLHTCRALEEEGCEVTYLRVNEMGQISVRELEKAIRPDTVLISVMTANNEVGTIQPVREIGKIARRHHILFHTDAVQAYGHLPLPVKRLGIDMMSASGHKCNGPKGIGFLYVRKGVDLPPCIHGGGQERGKRAGTENVPGIVGLGMAARLAHTKMAEREKKTAAMRDYLIRRLLNEVPFARLNGSLRYRLAGNCNISFQFIEGAALLVLLDEEGICAAAGSACSTGSKEPSHVLKAMGLPDNIAHGTLRLTIGYQNTMEEMDRAVECIKKCVARLRQNSPEFEDYMSGRKMPLSFGIRL